MVGVIKNTISRIRSGNILCSLKSNINIGIRIAPLSAGSISSSSGYGRSSGIGSYGAAAGYISRPSYSRSTGVRTRSDSSRAEDDKEEVSDKASTLLE